MGEGRWEKAATCRQAATEIRVGQVTRALSQGNGIRLIAFGCV